MKKFLKVIGISIVSICFIMILIWGRWHNKLEIPNELYIKRYMRKNS